MSRTYFLDWKGEVLAFFDTRAPNAPTESANVKFTSIRRAARGVRHCNNDAVRISLHAGRHGRTWPEASAGAPSLIEAGGKVATMVLRGFAPRREGDIRDPKSAFHAGLPAAGP